MFDISNQTREDIIEHAKSCAPLESCGLVMGDKYVPCPNIAPEEFCHTTFQIAPATMAEAYQSGQLRAVIHSHPAGPNGPTKTDMEQQAASDVPWGIVVLHEQNRPELFFWGDSLPIAPYEGRVFRHGIADCYALVRDWYLKEQGVVLPFTPRDTEWWNIGQNVIEENLANFDFSPIGENEALKYGDVPLFTIGAPVVNHTGIYIGNGLVLHHLCHRLSRPDVLGPWKQKYLSKTLRPNFVLQSTAQRAA